MASTTASAAAAPAKLFNNTMCPYAQRSWLVALEKGIIGKEVTLVDTELPTPAWYNKEINPRETLPALQLADGSTVLESAIVAQYLIEAYPERGAKLLPEDPKLRADLRLFLGDTDTLIQGLFKTFGANKKSKEVWESDVKGDVKYINDFLTKQSEGPFFLGDRFSYADIHIAPFLYRMSIALKELDGIDILAEAPRVKGLLEAIQKRESFVKTAPAPEAVVARFRARRA
jgi:glutathione S-transferase